MTALVGEVTSTNHPIDTGAKPATYAAVGIPVSALIDRHAKTAHCYTDPVRPGDDPTEACCSCDTKVTLGDPLRSRRRTPPRTPLPSSTAEPRLPGPR
jgi:hypothetical protein